MSCTAWRGDSCCSVVLLKFTLGLPHLVIHPTVSASHLLAWTIRCMSSPTLAWSYSLLKPPPPTLEFQDPFLTRWN
ncbi:hypothetical protein F2Q70_00030687 [Brassica cretica]|uniref:Uncharacterized protein n=1 Tax=Brassica cretica TaxID=69181 RepID=A0A8S9FJB5_BRACR|nr:hypothetical protein F2Q70_00030687 [Brassica cretica]